MFSLKPTLEIPAQTCPHCHSLMTAEDFSIVGMRNLAQFQCSSCGTAFYGDLPAGQGLLTPVLLDGQSGAVFHDQTARWFADWLAESYQNRTDDARSFEVKIFSEVKKKVVLLNCLDVLYGHSLLKLLNAQYYLDRQSDCSLIILLPKFLEWLVPEGAAQIWIVDLPLRCGTEWNDWLAAQIKRNLAPFDQVFLSVAFSHPRSEDFDIERFSRVAPFDIETLGRHQNQPCVTFIWREDRLWETVREPNSFEKIKRRLRSAESPIAEQTAKVVEFAETLRGTFPKLDLAVAGLGEAGNLPSWIEDLRVTKINEETERKWCGRYAASHLVVGVHGSNMLLPSAHAGSVIEIIGADRSGNFLQDILFRGSDVREMFFRYRFVPPEISPRALADLALTVLRYEEFRRLMGAEFCSHREKYDFDSFKNRSPRVSNGGI